MSNYINPVVINPVTMKPILFTTYETVTKYNLTITYEDSTTKTVELVQGDKNRPYTVTFKKDGKLITATGVPTVREISERSKFCDFVNRTMDSNDLLIELDCSSEYKCTKTSFYLKDIRDIIDLKEEATSDLSITDLSEYIIYLNGFQCTTKILCEVDDENNIDLEAQVTKLGEPLQIEGYSDFTVFTTHEGIKLSEGEDNLFRLNIPEELLNTEIKLVIKYFIKEEEHAVFDEFTVIPFIDLIDEEDEIVDTGTTLSRAVSTQDMQYLGDGLLPALGTGLTPSYKEYRNRKNAPTSVMMDE